MTDQPGALISTTRDIPETENLLEIIESEDLSHEEHVDAYKFLSSLREFSKLPAIELRTLAEHCRFSTLDAGQYITTEGDEESANGFIVASGRLAMLKTSTSGKQLTVELLQGGDIFGLLLMLAADKLPSQLSARAVQRSRVLWVPINNFMVMLKANPVQFQEFVAHLLICLQSSYNLSRGLAHDLVEVRIAAVLSSMALKFARPLTAAKGPTIHITRQQIADLVGTTSETAIRVTGAMQRAGLIDIKRPGILRVLKPEALQALADGD